MFAPSAIQQLYNAVHKGIPSSKLGGIVGDERHVANGGYHISRALLIAHGQRGDYSIQQSRDKTGDPNAASALDITLSAADMKTVTNRLLAAKNDSRMKPIREFFGCNDGVRIVGWDWSTNHSTTSSDLSHRWHVHLSVHRDSTADAKALAKVADVILGVKPTVIDKVKTAVKPKPKLRQKWPSWVPSGSYFGPRSGPANSLGGASPREVAALKLVQIRWNEVLGIHLKVDGIWGPAMDAAWRTYSKRLLKPHRGVDHAVWNKLFTY